MFRTASFLLLSAVLLGACARNDPPAVAQSYWDAVLAGDQETIRSLIVEGAEPELSSVIKPGSGSTVTTEGTERKSFAGPTEGGGNTAEVPTTVRWVDEGQVTTFETDTILVFEDGVWKVDPAQTRAAFFDSVYRSALSGLEAALEESAQSFRELGNTVSESMARELTAASRELQEQTEKANEELKKFIESLDAELQEELERRQAQ